MIDPDAIQRMEPGEYNMRVWADKKALEVIDQQKARIVQIEAALTKIYGKASAGDPSHYNQTMTEIIDIACSVSETEGDDGATKG
jgi:hypothetical protein